MSASPGRRLLEARIASLPSALPAAFTGSDAAGAPADDLARGERLAVERVVTTGVGSSAAHARFLASVLAELGVPARALPITSFLAPPPSTAAGETLVVFSQGLSPNVRPALARVGAWREVWLATSGGGAGEGPPESGAAPAAGDSGPATVASLRGPRPAAVSPHRAHPPPGGDGDARRRALDDARRDGVRLLRYPGADEYGTLLRVIGPMTGYAAALRFAAAATAGGFGPEPPSAPRPAWLDFPVDEICRRVADAARTTAAIPVPASLGFVAGGAHLERVANLRLKVLEGALLPEPPLWDLLDFAHGPFQQMVASPATLIALERADAPGESELLARLASMLDDDRHRLLRLATDLPGPLAIFEHEARLNALVLRWIEERGIDPTDWPGRGGDGPLYSFGGLGGVGVSGPFPRAGRRTAESEAPAMAPDEVPTAVPAVAPDEVPTAMPDVAPDEIPTAAPTAVPPASPAAAPPPRSRRLEEMTWPELDAFLAAGDRAAILPLGSIEQHGPHLPFATDAWIASELARRLVERVPEAVGLPVIGLGCAVEHLSFAGTLSLREETLRAVLCDVAASLARHGFARLFVFSAHGGNRAAVAAAVPEMIAAAPGLEVVAAAGLGAAMRVFHAASARHGVAAAASGHHAGEFETSILLRLAPHAVRRDRFAPGRLDVPEDPGRIFYPDLRVHAPDGTVGDPRGADAARADAYLDAWVAELLAAYRRAASRKNTKGRKNE